MHKVLVFTIFGIEIIMVGTLVKYHCTLACLTNYDQTKFLALQSAGFSTLQYIIRIHTTAKVQQFHYQKSFILLHTFQVKYCIKYTCWDV